MNKILLIANTDWYLYNFRLSLANTLRKNTFKVVFVSPMGEYARLIQAQGFDWVEWKLGRRSVNPWLESCSIIQLCKIFRQERPDIVHAHTIKAVLYSSIAASISGQKNIINSITGRGYIFLNHSFTGRLLQSFIGSIIRLKVDHPDCVVIFENEDDQQFFQQKKLLHLAKQYIIPGVGVDPHRFVPTPEPEGTPLVIYPGRMLWYKGVGVLAEAARLLRQRTSLRVALVGIPDPGNPSSLSIQELQGWVDQGIIEWWGWQDDMSKIYPQSNIVVLPSMAEGIPTVLLEAAACARAVVSTDAPGCRDIVRDQITGLLVPAQNPQALADAILRLIQDTKLRHSMGQAGRQLILQYYTADTINQQTMQIYQNLLKSN